MSSERFQMSFEGKLGEQPAGRPHTEGQPPMNLLVLGDFSGRGRRQPSGDLAGRAVLRVDRDNLDQLLGRLDVRLAGILLDLQGRPADISFSNLDDFHPDALYARVPLFSELQAIREGLLKPETFDEAAALVRQWGELMERPLPSSSPDVAPANPAGANGSGPNGSGGTQEPASSDDPAALDPASLLEQAIAQSEALDPAAASGPGAGGQDAFQQFVDDVVRPYVVPAPDARRDELVAWTDATVSGLMRELMHHPGFQALEAAWRGLEWLVRNVETNERVRIHVCDVSQEELMQDLASEASLEGSQIMRALRRATDGPLQGEPWGVMLGLFSLDRTPQDALLAGCLAALADHCQTSFVAAAEPRLVGCPDYAMGSDVADWELPADQADAVWAEVRKLPSMDHLALATPRFLLRLPYGGDTVPVERFDFQEQTDPPEHHRYLWGNSALLCGCALARAFDRFGWKQMRAALHDDLLEFGPFPLHVFREHGQATLKPPAEIWMSDKAAGLILDAGAVAIAALHQQDRVRILRLQSIADPIQPLTGRWS